MSFSATESIPEIFTDELSAECEKKASLQGEKTFFLHVGWSIEWEKKQQPPRQKTNGLGWLWMEASEDFYIVVWLRK